MRMNAPPIIAPATATMPKTIGIEIINIMSPSISPSSSFVLYNRLSRLSPSPECSFTVLADNIFERILYNLALSILSRLRGYGGDGALTKIKDSVPRTRKIIITGYSTVQNAIKTVNKNAHAYLLKPFDIAKVLFDY